MWCGWEVGPSAEGLFPEEALLGNSSSLFPSSPVLPSSLERLPEGAVTSTEGSGPGGRRLGGGVGGPAGAGAGGKATWGTITLAELSGTLVPAALRWWGFSSAAVRWAAPVCHRAGSPFLLWPLLPPRKISPQPLLAAGARCPLSLGARVMGWDVKAVTSA